MSFEQQDHLGSGSVGDSSPLHVLVFPFPAQGHMIPLLDLAHLLSLRRNLSITVLVTPKNLPLLRPLLSRSPSIETLVLPLPSHPSLPPGAENIRGLPLSCITPLMHALGGLRDPILNWAHSCRSPPDAILSDFFLGWTHGVAAELGIPRLVFCPSSALTLSVGHCLWRDTPRNGTGDENFAVAFPSIPGSPVYPWRELSPLYRGYAAKKGDTMWEFIKQGFLDNVDSWGYVFNTFNAVEAPYLRHITTDLGHRRVWAAGPLLPPDDGAALARGGSGSEVASGVLGWLNACAGEEEVFYVCFGSQTVLSRAQAETVAAALEASGARFLWCTGRTDEAEDLEERADGRGLVVRGWAPQVAILRHPAVGWFLTHCGWNSVLEAISGGVAMLTWPMTADQFLNARFLVQELQVAVAACEGQGIIPEAAALADVIAGAVRGSGTERARAMILREKAAEAMRDGGSLQRELDDMVEALLKVNRRSTVAGEDTVAV